MLNAILKTPLIWATIIVLASLALDGRGALTLFVVGVTIGILDILIVYFEDLQSLKDESDA